MPDVQTYLDEFRDLACAPLLRLLTEQVLGLDADVQPEAGTFGLRFRFADRLLCEFSVFGEMFIARVGPHGAVEYRVRSLDVAREALHGVLREFVQLRAASSP
jgi:hypothetical protein